MLTGIGSRVLRRLRLLTWIRAAGWTRAVPVAGFMLVDVALPAAIAVATGRLVASVIGAGGRTGAVVRALLVLIALLLADQVVGQLAQPFRRYLSARVDGAVRRECRRALVAPSGIAHLEDQSVRDDAHRVARGVTGRTLGDGVEAQLRTMFTFAGAAMSAGVAATVAPELAAFTAGAMLLQRYVLYRQASGYVQLASSLTGRSRRGRYWIDVAGGVQTAKEIRLFGLQRWAVDRQYDEAMRARRPMFEAVDGFNRKQWVPFTTGALGYGIPFAVLALRAVEGTISPAELAMVAPALFAIGMIGSPGFDMFAIQAAIPCAESAERLARLVPSKNGHASVPANASVRFEEVSFTYPGTAEPVLEGLTLEIPAGRSLAVVGANGAGKTTLIKLLTGLYEPTAGRITAGGVDVAAIDPAGWRRRVSVIFQDFVHYELSAADNVGLAELGAVDAGRLDSAAADADASRMVEQLPRGWQSILSRGYSGGAELSGGQWQRVALARLLYGLHAGREILILDEPTANLDVEAEIELFDRLLDRSSGRTVVLISHRFSTVRRADRVVVVDKGRVVEDGTHAELLARGGMYAQMFHSQADRYAGTE